MTKKKKETTEEIDSRIQQSYDAVNLDQEEDEDLDEDEDEDEVDCEVVGGNRRGGCCRRSCCRRG